MIYKYLVFLDVQSGELDNELVTKLKKRYNFLCKIEAKGITTARKMALAKLDRFAKKTKLPWILIEETGSIIGKADGRSDRNQATKSS